MIKKTKVLNYSIFTNTSEVEEQIGHLIQLSKAACDLSHAPYSNFKVGASILLQNGAFIQGANQENAAYPMCTCAEQVAIYNAAIHHPGVPVVALAIHVNVDNSVDNPPSPCGACRQVILETEIKFDTDIAIYISSKKPEIFRFENIKSLLPFYFSGKDLI
jgi:cytidine deaminase